MQVDDNCQFMEAHSLMKDEFVQLVVTGIGYEQVSLIIECDSLRVDQTAD